MKQPSVYLKMRVLGAVDTVEVSLTSLWSYFGRKVADLASERRMFFTAGIW